MGITCGIVGLPNVGKSTLFNALTAAGAVAANYPFATVEPNVGIALVPDNRLDALAAIAQREEIVPTAIEFNDIAGLVAGASQGEGLGNQFLGHIREVDAIAHVVRVFDDANVAHVGGAVDPVNDVETVNTELALADLGTVERATSRLERKSKSGDAEAAAGLDVVSKLGGALADGMPARTVSLTPAERDFARGLFLLTAKPMIYVANTDSTGCADHVTTLEAVAGEHGAELIALDGQTEAEIAELAPADREPFLEEMGLAEPGLARMIRAVYRLLGLSTYFTIGDKQVQAWTFRKGETAPQAAGQIHSDFEKGFIRAEVIGYDDFISHGGEAGAKQVGKWRVEGKDYVVQEGDVILFRFNT